VIGPSGAPVDNAGFLLTVVSNKRAKSEGAGYVDGSLCENEQDFALDAQPDLPGLPAAHRRGHVHRLPHVGAALTPLDDAAMLEEALGGADQRVPGPRTVWQVKPVASLGAVGSAGELRKAGPA